MKINNCLELWTEWIGESSYTCEERAKSLLKKVVFKGTECGCIFDSDEKGIMVGGYAEGSDAELPTYDLEWGFTINAFKEALDYADADGVEAWHEANDEDLVRVVDEEETPWEMFLRKNKLWITEEEWNEENSKNNPGSN